MKTLPARLALLVFLLCMPLAALAQTPDQAEIHSLKWELYRDGDPAPDAELLAVLWLTLNDGYHAYANPSGQTGLPTTLTVSVDSGVPLPVVYPAGEEEPDVFDPAMTVNTYEGTTPLFVRLGHLPAGARNLTGTLSFAACSQTNCWPMREPVSLSLAGVDPAALPDARELFWYEFHLSGKAAAAGAAVTEESEPATDQPALGPVNWDFSPRYFRPELEVTGLGLALTFAFIAGLLLNFMPCVLPVLSLKLSGLMAGSEATTEADRIRAFREHNMFFSLGVLAYFLFLGGIFSALGLAWGQIFQTPGLILVLAVVVFALGLSLFGLWNLPVVDLKADSTSGNPKACALFTGVLATLLATPCSGPFLGGVLGWVLLQRPEVIMAVFLTIGLGMCSPFLVMTARPGLVRLFPRPGAWMGYLEAGVGFFLMGTVLYLLSILPQAMLLSALALLFTVAFAAWMWGHWTNLSQPAGRRWSVRLAAVTLVALAALMLFAPRSRSAHWTDFKPHVLTALLGQRAVMVDFTADWCPNCKALEHTALAEENLARWQAQYDLVLVQVDMTQDNPEGLELLRALGSQSIPVVALFPPGEEHRSPLVLRDLFSTAQMDEALKTTLTP